MRVACIGNMNNNMFSLVRFLRRKGIAADLLRLSNENLHGLLHFHPRNDTFNSNDLQFVRDLEWGDASTFYSATPAQIRTDLGGYDVLIGCGAAPAFLIRAGLTLDLFLSYGADLYQLPFLDAPSEYLPAMEDRPDGVHVSSPARILKRHDPEDAIVIDRLRQAHAQAAGLAACRKVVSRNPRADAILAKCGFRGERLACDQPIVFTQDFNPVTMLDLRCKSPMAPMMEALRARHRFMVFHHARHVWRNPMDAYSAKGNDVLVRGFAAFASSAEAPDSCLVMLEYGPEVEATRALVAELGISERVVWLPTLPRRDIFACLSWCDVGAAEFSGGWLTGGCIVEPLAMGLPLLSNRDDARYSGDYPTLYPMMNVSTPDAVAAALAALARSPEQRAEMGEAGRQWLERHIIRDSLDRICSATGLPL